MAESYSVVYMHHFLFIHSSIDGHLGCFHTLATVNNAAIKIWIVFLIYCFGFLCINTQKWNCWVLLCLLLIAFALKFLLSVISIAILAFVVLFCFHFHEISFFIPLLSICVCPSIWRESLVDSRVRKSCFVIQPLYIFWLEQVIYLHLK